MTLPARDLASRLDAAQSILAGLSLATVSTLDAPSIYRDKLAASKHRRFRQRMQDMVEVRRHEAHIEYLAEAAAKRDRHMRAADAAGGGRRDVATGAFGTLSPRSPI